MWNDETKSKIERIEDDIIELIDTQREMDEKIKELSSKDGMIHLVEYIEEFPPLLSQVGMGSRIRNYCRKDDEDTSTQKFTTGEMVYVENKEESPFLGKIKGGEPIQSLDNKIVSFERDNYKIRENKK